MSLRTYNGTYASLINGVSQQTPQERTAGQVAAQMNMLSDAASGLRRRSGAKFLATYNGIGGTKPFLKLIQLSGNYYTLCISTSTGKLSLYSFDTHTEVFTKTDAYFIASSVKSLKVTVARDIMVIVNTEKVPTKHETGASPTEPDPKTMGCLTVTSGALAKEYSCTISFGTYKANFAVTTSSNTAEGATVDWVATNLAVKFAADTTVNAAYTIDNTVKGKVCLVRKDGNTTDTLSITTSHSTSYMIASNNSRVDLKSSLPTNLPDIMDNWICAVGVTGNSSYFKYSKDTKHWKECGVWEKPFETQNEPKQLYFDSTTSQFTVTDLGIAKRAAGDDDNNPYPKFFDYGITGIGAYQSRLVILSGSYVHLSKTTDFGQFMRTTVEELLDDDAIEVASAVLSGAQWEYAIPFNKDLVLVSLQQQAVIPANNTVLTPKTTVIYPSTQINLSVAAEPTVVGRSLYYAYQRSTDYFQLGEFIPSDYTASQYYGQNLNDHLPLYAVGECTRISSSTSNNMALATSDTNEILVNQFLWSGNQRPLMAFHKWSFIEKVIHTEFIDDYSILYFFNPTDGCLRICSMNTQYNLRDDKPTPYLDFYESVQVVADQEFSPVLLTQSFIGTKELTAVIYDDADMRYMVVPLSYNSSTGKYKVPYTGTIILGFKYKSEVVLTPPFLKDNNGNVLAGTNAFVHSFDLTTKLSGAFNYTVYDNYGLVVDDADSTVLTWSEADLGHTQINSLSKVRIPCRTKLESTYCRLSTNSTTEFNIISVDYTVRVAQRFQRM